MMPTTRQVIRDYLLRAPCNSVTGHNDRTVQYQGDWGTRKVFALYNEEGDWEREVYDVEEALDYIGLKEARR